MLKILTATSKELRLLFRDRAGLLVLFLMPAILVIIITLVQENILELSGQKKTEILMLDRDDGAFSVSFRSYLEAEQIEIKEYPQGKESQFRRLIADGKYQAGVIIDAGTSKKLQEETAQRFMAATHSSGKQNLLVPLHVIFDPAAMVGFRAGILARLQMAAKAAETEMVTTQLEEFLAQQIGRFQSGGTPSLISKNGLKNAFSKASIRVTEQHGDSNGSGINEIMNPVNQNVPAWALFGMFFTAIPIAGTILAERRSGIAVRLAGMPVSPLQLLAGKVIAYLGVCLCQFVLIVVIGMYLFPRLGLTSFTLPQQPLDLLPVVVASSLAACGFGAFLGSVCRSYEQASTLGSTMVVIAAALGGVMVPVYAMPQLMQKISILSPINWGVNAFLDLLVRGETFSATFVDMGRLILFSVVMIILSWKRLLR